MDRCRLRPVSRLVENSRVTVKIQMNGNEWRIRERQVARASAEDERKERLHWFYKAVQKPGTLVTESFNW